MALQTYVKEPEKSQIKEVAAKMVANNQNTNASTIAEVVNRDPKTVSKVLREDNKFLQFLEAEKIKITKKRLKAMNLGDQQVVEAVQKGKMDPYRLIGMSKTYWDQVFSTQDLNQGTTINGQQIAVQITRGNIDTNQSYSQESPDDVPK